MAGCANHTSPATFRETSDGAPQGSANGGGTLGSGGLGGVGASQGTLANLSSLDASSSSPDVANEATFPVGLQCSVSCSGGADTTITGKV